MPTRIASVDELRDLYREPSALVKSKIQGRLDATSVHFIERCPFVLVATNGADGRLDVSPRGGPIGFIRVRADGSIAIPDLNGNNLVDTLRGIVETGRAGLLFVLPGRDETLRVNGNAYVTADPTVLNEFTDELRTPKSAIVVEPHEVFVHCAKAFRRGSVWQSDSWAVNANAPGVVEIISCQLDLTPEQNEALSTHLQQGYIDELAAD
jgi:uncharacterized protein